MAGFCLEREGGFMLVREVVLELLIKHEEKGRRGKGEKWG